ncbi:MAG: phage tail protein [Pseudomonadota bacterium]
MSGGTINQSETRAEALQLQSSAYGVTIPWVRGVNRIAGNLLWYGGFKAIPHTTTQGGKGGGPKVQSTTYTYAASVMMGLGRFEAINIPRVWRGKKLYSGGMTPSQLVTVVEEYTPPLSGAMQFTAAHAATFAADLSITNTEGTGDNMMHNTLARGIDYSVSAGVYTILSDVWRGRVLGITYQYTVGGVAQTALQQLGLTFKAGAFGQSVWSGLTSFPVEQQIGYSGLALVAGQDYDLGDQASIENHNFEVIAPGAYSVSSSLPDTDPAASLRELLADAISGAGFPGQQLDTWTSWSDFCIANGLLVSPALEEQKTAAEVLQFAAELGNAAPVWSGGKLKMIPRSDEAASGNGRTYTPNTTPVYELDDTCYVPADGEPPVVRELKSPADRFNHVRVNFRNRANQYAPDMAEAKDQADIDAHGLRSKNPIDAPWICDASVARLVAQIIMQRSLCVTGTYSVPLPVHFSLLECMDLVTLTESTLELLDVPVRIIEITEQNPQGDLLVKAEDYPPGTAAPALYPSQAGEGFQHDYNVAPGGVQTPAFFEAPVNRTETGLEVYAAVRGAGQYWGGCGVWVSLDGLEFKRVGTVWGPSRYGQLTGPIAGGALPVNTSGQLISGSAEDAAALATLCYVGGSSPEYLAYTTATLTGPGAYSLAGLQRGAYGTAQDVHAAGDLFVRVDEGLAKSGPLDLGFIGKTLHMKCTSFNIYGGAEESIADVPAYTYLVTGAMAQLPPSQPTGLGYTLQPFGVQVHCLKNPEPDVVAYQWRAGAAWDTAQVLQAAGGTSYPWAVQVTGTQTVWVAAVDKLGNVSTPASMPVEVTAPTMASLDADFAGAELVLAYQGAPGAFAIQGYEIRFGDVFDTAQVVTFQQVTRWTKTVDWGGARRWWVVPVDVRGNYGTPASVDTAIQAPGQVTAARAEVVDNNVLLYWAQPATGTLPIDRYEVRKGASWAAGTLVGSNGNSTFAAVFEQLGGSYSYWVAAFDSAGNQGAPLAINATVNQPPDYLLRVDYNDDFTGTCSGCHVENGKVYGPALLESIQTHFESRGWASIDAQMAAGYPLVFMPSGTSGYYERVLDYGTALPSTTITVTPTVNVLSGAVTTSLQVSYKALSGDPWIDAPANQAQVLAAGFRYVKVRVTFTAAAGGDDLAELAQLNVKLASKLKNDAGSGTANAADAGGTSVSFNVSFIDVTSIGVTASGTAARYALYDFVDAPNPTGFKVLLFDNNGNRVSGAFSWTARGY